MLVFSLSSARYQSLISVPKQQLPPFQLQAISVLAKDSSPRVQSRQVVRGRSAAFALQMAFFPPPTSPMPSRFADSRFLQVIARHLLRGRLGVAVLPK